ncbi:DUF2057 family protein [Neptuniibacter sp. QD48_11]|uniref:YccT family protein n=1 Tax=unclassified Neptuniibacter TaxID=2630693 RepID=UPI0039F62A88
MKKLALLVTLISAPHVMADNQLILGEGIKVHAINGSESVSSFFSNDRSLNLPDGNNQLLVSYTAEIKNGSDYELEQSHPSVLLFSSEKQTLTLKTPEIKNTRQLEHFNRELNWQLKNDKNPIQFKAELLPLKGFRLGIDFERELADFNRSNSNATQQVSVIETPTVLKGDKVTDEQMKLILLKSLYQQASSETQEAFKSFIQ